MARMRHDCQDGAHCYLETAHAPIHVFDGCFGGRIEMSDIDGVIERRGNVMFMEWKTSRGAVSEGQDRLFRALTNNHWNQTVMVVWGPPHPAPDTTVTTVMYRRGQRGPQVTRTLAQLQALLQRWYAHADAAAPVGP